MATAAQKRKRDDEDVDGDDGLSDTERKDRASNKRDKQGAEDTGACSAVRKQVSLVGARQLSALKRAPAKSTARALTQNEILTGPISYAKEFRTAEVAFGSRLEDSWKMITGPARGVMTELEVYFVHMNGQNRAKLNKMKPGEDPGKFFGPMTGIQMSPMIYRSGNLKPLGSLGEYSEAKGWKARTHWAKFGPGPTIPEDEHDIINKVTKKKTLAWGPRVRATPPLIKKFATWALHQARDNPQIQAEWKEEMYKEAISTAYEEQQAHGWKTNGVKKGKKDFKVFYADGTEVTITDPHVREAFCQIWDECASMPFTTARELEKGEKVMWFEDECVVFSASHNVFSPLQKNKNGEYIYKGTIPVVKEIYQDADFDMEEKQDELINYALSQGCKHNPLEFSDKAGREIEYDLEEDGIPLTPSSIAGAEFWLRFYTCAGDPQSRKYGTKIYFKAKLQQIEQRMNATESTIKNFEDEEVPLTEAELLELEEEERQRMEAECEVENGYEMQPMDDDI